MPPLQHSGQRRLHHVLALVEPGHQGVRRPPGPATASCGDQTLHVCAEEEEEVLAAARARAEALGRRDEVALRRLLHPRFVWTSHRGEVLDREDYLRSNTRGANRWYAQLVEDPRAVVVNDTAVLRCTVIDDVDTGQGRQRYRMPVTQTWVRLAGHWTCLAGHAGPRLT